MIKTVVIRNFQSHKKSILNLSKGVNVIVGKTDSGKSAIIRALRWLFTNTPSGDAFRSWDGGDTKVSATFYDMDKKITRIKGNKNAYIVETLDEQSVVTDKKEYTGIGTDVPEPIENLFNINSINMQAQLDSPFLLSETPGEVARFFNRVAHLDKIDLGQYNIKKWMREIEKCKSINEKTIEENKQKIEEHNYLYKLQIDVENLEELQNKRDKQKQRIASLQSLIDSIEKVDNELKDLEIWKEIEVPVSILVEQIETLDKQIKNRNGLFLLIEKLNEVNLSLKDLDAILPAEKKVHSLLKKNEKCDKMIEEYNELVDLIESIENVELAEETHRPYFDIEPEVKKLISLAEAHKAQSKQYDNLEALITLLENNERQLKDAFATLQKYQKQYDENFPEVCPLCGSNTHHQHTEL
jgi:chromosome segregation ATPase